MSSDISLRDFYSYLQMNSYLYLQYLKLYTVIFVLLFCFSYYFLLPCSFLLSHQQNRFHIYLPPWLIQFCTVHRLMLLFFYTKFCCQKHASMHLALYLSIPICSTSHSQSSHGPPKDHQVHSACYVVTDSACSNCVTILKHFPYWYPLSRWPAYSDISYRMSNRVAQLTSPLNQWLIQC